MNPFPGDSTPYAGFWRRVGARLVDGLIFTGLHILLYVLAFVFAAEGEEVGAAGFYSVGSLGLLLVSAIYLVGFWASGQTLGQKALSIRIVRDVTGEPPGVGAAIGRYVVSWFSSFLLLGYLWAAWDRRHQTWHDKVTGTIVILDEQNAYDSTEYDKRPRQAQRRRGDPPVSRDDETVAEVLAPPSPPPTRDDRATNVRSQQTQMRAPRAEALGYLAIASGPGAGKIFELGEETTIGRPASGNDIELDDEDVSRRHGRIRLRDGVFTYTDLDSTNGTRLQIRGNVERLREPYSFHEGDRILIGPFVLSFSAVKS